MSTGRADVSRLGAWLRSNAVFTVVLAGLLAALVYGIVHRHLLSRIDVIFLLALVPSVMLHEVSHGVVALWCGDDTAKRAGRITLNPLRHIDPIGSVILPVLMIFTVHRAFGWAKPVPVRVDRLRHPRNQSVLVSLAGPVTNIVVSAIAGVALHFYLRTGGSPAELVVDVLVVVGTLNLYIAAFNLIPIPPLDGSALVERALPARWLPGYYRMRMGFMLVVLFVVLVARAPLIDLFNWLDNLWINAVNL
jgi:Zn-dependent protease